MAFVFGFTRSRCVDRLSNAEINFTSTSVWSSSEESIALNAGNGFSNCDVVQVSCVSVGNCAFQSWHDQGSAVCGRVALNGANILGDSGVTEAHCKARFATASLNNQEEKRFAGHISIVFVVIAPKFFKEVVPCAVAAAVCNTSMTELAARIFREMFSMHDTSVGHDQVYVSSDLVWPVEGLHFWVVLGPNPVDIEQRLFG